MEFRAEAKYIRVSPQKARLVLDTIKGRRAEDAMNILAFTKKGIAPDASGAGAEYCMELYALAQTQGMSALARALEQRYPQIKKNVKETV